VPENKNITIYTIGHSNHSFEHFISLLEEYGIKLVIDVRSVPYSRFCPHFNKKEIAQSLLDVGIGYDFHGVELGARPTDLGLYVDKQVDFTLLAQQPGFQNAVENIIALSADKQIALMCSEKDPLKCHRTILIGRELKKQGVCLQHILSDAGLIGQDDVEKSLIKFHKLFVSGKSLFDSDIDLVGKAYDLQAKRISCKLAT
jgi:uncharacterized protein (DUF488 family)